MARVGVGHFISASGIDVHRVTFSSWHGRLNNVFTHTDVALHDGGRAHMEEHPPYRPALRRVQRSTRGRASRLCPVANVTAVFSRSGISVCASVGGTDVGDYMLQHV